VDVAQATGEPLAVVVQERIKKLEEKMKKSKEDLKPLQQAYTTLASEVNRGRALLARLKNKLIEFRSTRKKSNAGVEAKMVRVLKLVGVEIQRYHGGSLAGMDIKKVIANASFVFDEFEEILKEERNQNKDCEMTNKEISTICNEHKTLYLLWDGAFSAARTINPTEDDRTEYCRYVYAAVHCHVKIGCSVTHKVHLMWAHVASQMGVPGGLGEKMEDWVEKMHQWGNQRRKRFGTTKNTQVRADARARSTHRGTNPGVIAQGKLVASEAKRNLKNSGDKEIVGDARKAGRKAARLAALERWETERHAVVVLRRAWRRSRSTSVNNP
jgi:uncharacterized coiled-coil protein SlyX